MANQGTGDFGLTNRDEQACDESDGARLARVRNTKTFTGDIDRTSTTELLQVIAQHGSAGYVAIERVTGQVQGRSGTVVPQHSAVGNASGGSASVTVVPDSGTSILAITRDAVGVHHYTFDHELG